MCSDVPCSVVPACAQMLLEYTAIHRDPTAWSCEVAAAWEFLSAFRHLWSQELTGSCAVFHTNVTEQCAYCNFIEKQSV